MVAGSIPAAPAKMYAQDVRKMAAQETTVQTNTSRWKKFLREVKAELKKVTWPGKQELISFTGIVFVTVAVVAALIWVIDTSFTQLLKAIIK